MKYRDDRNVIKMIHEILTKRTASELGGMHEAYGLPKNILDTIHVSFYVKSDNMKKWKGGNTRFVKIFETECKILLRHKRIDFKELGFLTFLAITFTNFEDNTLRNPDGTACLQKDIIAESGMGRTAISTLMNTLTDKKLLFERKSYATPNGKSYFLNPMLFYRGTKMENRQAEILNSIKNDIHAVWKSNSVAENIISDHMLTIEKAVEDIILVEQEVINDFYNQAMGISRDDLSFKMGIREETNPEIPLQ